jgi:hypothetical protein
VGVLFVMSGLSAAANASSDQVTLCHYNGQAGSDSYNTLTLPPNAASGHIDENGTPTAGHENDYLGECQNPETTTTVGSETTTTVGSETTTTVGSETTTTVGSETTTTVGSETTTTANSTIRSAAEEGSSSSGASEAIPTAASPTSTTTTSTTIGGDESTGGSSGSNATSATPAPVATSDTDSTAVEELPLTGASTFLVTPGVLLVMLGVLVVFVSGGFGGGSRAAHVAAEATGFGLGFHRGRHQR